MQQEHKQSVLHAVYQKTNQQLYECSVVQWQTIGIEKVGD